MKSSTQALTAPDKRAILAMAAVVALLMTLGWGTFFLLVLPGGYSLGNHALFGLGLAYTAFTLGIRHAFDADHIAAIDNTTRKLIEDGQRPLSVGFWFALGHSSVVIAAVAILAAGLNVLATQLSDDHSVLASMTSVWGTLVSAGFLLLVGGLNLASLIGIWRVARHLKAGGTCNETELEEQLQKRGVLYRVLGPVARRVDKPWKMYLVGFLFGLGFDTATEISLFVIGGSAALAVPWYVVLVLPLLFTAGMTLFDTLDGIVMNRIYGWAYERPVRKIYYNLAVTLMSVTVAFLVGGLGLCGLLAQQLHAKTGPLAWVASIDLRNFGFIMAGLFLATWLGALAYGKWNRVGDRSSAS